MSLQLTRAIAIATREDRKAGLASRLLDANVCGAVPPYRELLAGKLAALGLASDDVVSMYRARYERRESEIASRMAGRAVVREPDACVLTTTSLYGVASSQYNRLKLVVGSNGSARTVEWRDVGLTRDFGTLHLSRETIEALRATTALRRGRPVINNRFGDGTSARMRQAREALDNLGLSSDLILRHQAHRRVYGLELRPAVCRALRLNEPLTGALPTFNLIAAAWREWWLARRIASPGVLPRVAEQGPETVRRELAGSSGEQLTLALDGA